MLSSDWLYEELRGATILTAQDKPTIGFIGIGHMGSRMAQRLINSGYQLVLLDRTREKAEEIALGRASVAGTPKELARQCSVVIACVTNDDAQRDVMLGENGTLAGAHDSSVVIERKSIQRSLPSRSCTKISILSLKRRTTCQYRCQPQQPRSRHIPQRQRKGWKASSPRSTSCAYSHS